MSEMKQRIGLYARVSSEKQAQERTIESQISAIEDFVNSKNEKIDPDLYFIDDGISGATLERPGLDRLRDFAFRGGVEKVYVLSPDRLSRKSAHQILLIDEFKRLEVSFSFTNRDIGDTPEDQMLLQIQGVVAEYEREKILERSRRGKLHAAKQGKISVLGGAPFGYFYKCKEDNCDAQYIVHLEEARIVKEAFDLYIRNLCSMGDIAKQFTAKKYKTRTGIAFWERSVIWGMLKNPAYMGKAAFKKTKRVKRIKKTKLALESKCPSRSEYSSPRDRPKEEWIYIPVPAIVGESTFNAAQERLKLNKRFAPRNNKRYKYLLSGLLRCKTCNYAIYGKAASNSKYKRLYYRCAGQDGSRWPNGRVCKGHPVRVEAIDDLVWESVKTLISNPDIALNEYNKRLKKTSGKATTNLRKQKNDQIKHLYNEKERLIDLYQGGTIEKEETTTRLELIARKSNKLQQEVELLLSQEKQQKSLLTVVKNLTDFVSTLHTKLEQCSFEEKQRLVRLTVEAVEVDTINEEINVKHIIPIEPKKCLLRSGTHFTAFV